MRIWLERAFLLQGLYFAGRLCVDPLGALNPVHWPLYLWITSAQLLLVWVMLALALLLSPYYLWRIAHGKPTGVRLNSKSLREMNFIRLMLGAPAQATGLRRAVIQASQALYAIFIALWVCGLATWFWKVDTVGTVMGIEQRAYLFGGRYGVYKGKLVTLRLSTEKGEKSVVIAGRDMSRVKPRVGSSVRIRHHRFQRDFPWNRLVGIEPPAERTRGAGEKDHHPIN